MNKPAKFISPQLSLPFDRAIDPEDLFARVYRRLRPGAGTVRFEVNFREWAHPRSTICKKEGGYKVEVFDVLQDAPPIVIEALAEILIMGYYRRKPSREARACYLAHTMAPAIRKRIDEARRARGFKHMRPAQGRQHNLEEIFRSLNQQFFQGALKIRQIGWSRKASQTILGHHDPAHETITINRVLDRPGMPREVVESVVYHEMLHIVFPIERDHHRRVIHSARFRESERKFPGYHAAQRFLKSEGWAAG
ncbi:MAG: SprT-like domain-containing protein [Terriglobia bacterium]